MGTHHLSEGKKLKEREEFRMNKKGLSILLALSMVFSLNTFAFAEEAVVEEAAEEVVSVEDTQSVNEQSVEVQDTVSDDGWTKLIASARNEISLSGNSVSMGSTTLEAYCTLGSGGLFYYTGKKLTADRLNLAIHDTATGYSIPVKKIKITDNKKADATGVVKFQISGICGINDLGWSGGGVQAETAKAAYKDLQTKFKSAKNEEFSVYVMPARFTQDGVVSENLFNSWKSAKKTLSTGDLLDSNGYFWIGENEGDLDSTPVMITMKNSKVKSVQIPYVEYKRAKDSSGFSSDVYTIKLKTKKLKAKKDYTVSDDNVTVIFTDSAGYSSDSDGIRAT